jgi:tetratricopeptide (TPR) repeat protein
VCAAQEDFGLDAGRERQQGPQLRRDAILRQVEATMARGRPDEAARLAEQALAGGFEHPGLLSLVAFGCIQRDEPERALSLLERARTLSPADAHILNGLGIAYKRLGRAREALAALDAAVAVAPQLANAHFNRGTVLEAQQNFDGARNAYGRALALEPANDEALARLSYLAAMQGEYQSALDLGERAIKRHLNATPAALKLAQFALLRGDYAAAYTMAARALAPEKGNGLADVLLAQAELGLGELDTAKTRIQQVLAGATDPRRRAHALWVAAGIDDHIGDTSRAFAEYAASKEETRKLHAPQFTGPGVIPYREHVERAIAHFTNVPVEKQPVAAAGGNPVFLMGFPRSGTTLLQQVLAAHPGLATAEEMNPFPAAANDFFLAPHGWTRLAALDYAALAPYRETFWRIVRRAVPALEDRIYLDKNPLRMAFLPIVSRVFPGAKVVFSIRDPRDVVLSCLKQQFAMSLPMYELCTLEGCARLYDTVMRLYAVCRDKLPLDVLEVRHEDLVRDFAAVTRRISTFVGVEWTPAMRDVAVTTRTQLVTTPSAPQVARGLYESGEGWRRYREHLAPVMNMVAPWAARFGYPDA